MYTYLILNLLTISFPLLRSFENKIYFAGNWKYLFPAIITTAVFFVLWDHYFTISGVWSFNPEYLIGIFIFSLPLEEWLFFLTVPFACVFIYEVVKYFVKGDPLKHLSAKIIWTLSSFLLIVAFLHTDKLYTFITFLSTSLFLMLHWIIFKSSIFGKFFITYIIHLIPFLIVNGVLTSLPIVVYNNDENLSMRIFTIPIEDSVYSMLLLLINISIYEYLKKRKTQQTNFG